MIESECATTPNEMFVNKQLAVNSNALIGVDSNAIYLRLEKKLYTLYRLACNLNINYM